MKKTSIVFVAGALLSLASCQSNPADTGADQATIDSAVNARVEELKMQMMMQNDSIINAEAQRRADSIVAAMQGTASAPRPSAPARNTGGTRTGTTTTKNQSPTKTNDGRLDVKPADNDGRLDVNKTNDKRENDGRLKVK